MLQEDSQTQWQEKPFPNRRRAGVLLARLLMSYAGRRDVVVVGLARGGVPVAFEVARVLRAPLDVMVVRKLGVPGHEELAMGAIAGGVRVLNTDVVSALDISDEVIDAVERQERCELMRRERLYRQGRPVCELHSRIVVLVDDGLATGSTMRAAICAVRRQHSAHIVVAVPVAARKACEELARKADECFCAIMPEDFRAVSLWYREFTPVTDEEISALLGTKQSEAIETRKEQGDGA